MARGTRFDDPTGTALAGLHRPLRVWVLGRRLSASASPTGRPPGSWTWAGSTCSSLPDSPAPARSPGPQRCGSGARSGSTRPASSLAATGTRPPLTKGAPGAPAAAEGPARGWYARQGQVAGPGPAPARRRGRLAHAGGRPAHDDPAPHRGERCRRRPGAYRRARRPRPAGGAGLRARDRVPRPRRVRATRTATAAARSASARWGASDRCCAPGRGPIGVPCGRTPPAYPGSFRPVHDSRRRGKARLGTLLGGLLAPVRPHHPESQ